MKEKQSVFIQSSTLKIILFILGSAAILVALFIFPLAVTPAPAASLDSFTAALDQQVPDLLERYQIPGASLALVENSELVWTGAYGYADLDNNRKMTVSSPCRVQSISKSVTAWGVLKLVEDGVLELDSPLEKYLHSWQLPDTQFSEEQITIRQLLSQTSGMQLGTIGVHYSPDEPIPGLRENLSQEARLIKEPGGSFLYSNPGFNLLELVIEEVTSRDFAAYMESEVLNPLDMDQASFILEDHWQDEVPLAYDSPGNGIPVYLYPEKAAGGLFATAEDIATFLAAGMIAGSNPGGDVIREESVQLLYTPAAKLTGYYSLISDTYGMGHFIETLDSGETAVWHGGQGHGWMTHFHAVPESGDGIVILTNSQRSWPFFAHLLRDWADWNGISRPGMVLILRATRMMWGVTVLLCLLVLRTGWKLVSDFLQSRREFAPLSSQNRLRRVPAAAGSLIITIYLVMEQVRGYSFLSSIFPAVYPWLVIVLVFLAVLLLILSLFPEVKPDPRI